MASVTQRINEIQQPYGGYLPMKLFSKEQLDDGVTLHEGENIHPSLVGLAVDYLTRFMSGSTVDQAFHISTLGALLISMTSTATALKSQITGLDDQSITAACKLSGFDVCLRSSPLRYKPVEEISPDKATIENIRTMVNRSLRFWEKYGPILCSEPTFEGGYTDIVNTGDGDYVTQDTLWDFKVSKSAPKSKQTLQILMYYIMGLHSTHDYYKNIKQLGFYNPRLNIVYTCPISMIPAETIKDVERDVICYGGQRPAQTKAQTSTHAPTKKVTTKKDPQFNDLTVADICQITGRSKNAVYDDIRSGRLTAYKKGNKYLIPRVECDNYIAYLEQIEAQKETFNKVLLFALFAVGLVVLLFLIFAGFLS